jgi:bla regulator protein BlaR1
MIPGSLLPIANHLWQSTLFAGIAGLLTLLLRNNRAHARYCLWLAASAKFLVPCSLLVFAGSQFARHTAIAPTPSGIPVLIEQVNEPFGAEVSQRPMLTPHPSRSESFLLPTVLALWATGFVVLAFSWWRRWRRMQKVTREASPLELALGVPVLSSASFIEPGVFGVFRPVLLLPDGIAAELAPAELQAILAHELCHVRRRDNLATVMHMVVETLFWFHPLVWWLGSRLMQERELACDEDVLRSGSEPEAYAEGILKICERYLESPLKCMAGVTGANLKKRIEAIMDNRSTLNLSFAKKAALATAGTLALAIPVILGITNAPLLRAQAQKVDPDLRFEVASVRRVEIPNNARGVPVFPPTGGIGTSDPTHYVWHGAWLMNFMTDAFGVRADQIAGAAYPKIQRERYDIVANIPAGATKEQFNVMLGNLLRDRFHMQFHMDSKVIPVYALRLGKNGPKFKETASRAGEPTVPSGPIGVPDAQGFPTLPPNYKGAISRPRPGEIFTTSQDVTMADLARHLENPVVGRPIVDETGLTGHYDFKIHFHWRGGPTDAFGVESDPAPSVFTAVQEQLGLKLESSTHSFPQLVIDSIDRDPTEN